jgi:NAD(P)H dehydrogenase (quinone)
LEKNMTQVSIVYHSGYGHTKKLAESVLAGAQQVPGVSASLLAIDAEGNLSDAQWAELDTTDAIVFGSPTYMGNVSWQFKKFADASSKPWFSQAWKDKLFAGFTNSASMNGDKYNTLHYMMTLAMQHSGLWVGTGLMPSNSKAAQRNDINYLGSFGGLLGQSPSDSSPEEGPSSGDLETGKLFGKRVGEVAKRIKAQAA